MTRNCAACNDPTEDCYPAIRSHQVLCRDCHENGIRRSTMERVYRDEDDAREKSPRGIRVNRKLRDDYEE